VKSRYLFLAPIGAAFILAIVAPVVLMGVYSLYDTNFIFTRFVGLKNYADMLRDPRFLQAAGNTALFLVLMVPVGTFLPLWAALTAHGMSQRSRNLIRFGLYLPVLASGIVMAGTWRMLFDYRKGLVNWLIGLAGLGPVAWWMRRESAIPLISGIVVMSVWLGGLSAMYMAVLNSIPNELYEAARVDGASSGQIQHHILAPIIAPTIGFAMLGSIVNTLTFWEHIFLLTGGGPDGGTTTLAFHVFNSAFNQSRYGAASAQSLVLFLLTLGLALGREKIQRSFV